MNALTDTMRERIRRLEQLCVACKEWREWRERTSTAIMNTHEMAVVRAINQAEATRE